jgi:electron transport complex protein RnfE
LIVTNCTLLGRAESFASRNRMGYAVLDGFMMGLGFLLVLLVMGAVREILGQGTLFSNLHLLLGNSGREFEIRFWDSGFLLMVLPPGAFLTLGCLIALKNKLSGLHEI